ncbi:HET-domain-containing protein, partial [Stipitochalara longipes BDJ]
RVDIGFLKSMLQNCEGEHENCKVEAPTTPEGMSVIDLENMSIVYAPTNCRYFALSYVWGKVSESWLALTNVNVGNLNRKDSLVHASLPQTIRDAMQLCVGLNERYLWVDSLCIIQDDPIVQKQQIDIMDKIYASAVLTIVASAGDHANAGLPGVSTWLRTIQHQTITIKDIEVSNILPRLRDTADLSIWNTRGWTYQERMFSRRCIYLTEAQAYYAC